MIKKTLYSFPIILLLLSMFLISEVSANEIIEKSSLKESRGQHISPAIMALAKAGYHLIFFTSSQCKYCHQFAPIVKEVVDQYGFNISLISFDDQPTPPFTESTFITKDVYQIFYQNKTPFAPMLFLHHPTAQKFVPLSEGFTDRGRLHQVLMHYAEHPEAIQ